jgi:hypothetical protein
MARFLDKKIFYGEAVFKEKASERELAVFHDFVLS